MLPGSNSKHLEPRAELDLGTPTHPDALLWIRGSSKPRITTSLPTPLALKSGLDVSMEGLLHTR